MGIAPVRDMSALGHVRSFSDRPVRVRCWGKRKFEARRTGVGGTPDQISVAAAGAFIANKRERQDKLAKDRR